MAHRSPIEQIVAQARQSPESRHRVVLAIVASTEHRARLPSRARQRLPLRLLYLHSVGAQLGCRAGDEIQLLERRMCVRNENYFPVGSGRLRKRSHERHVRQVSKTSRRGSANVRALRDTCRARNMHASVDIGVRPLFL